MEAVLSVFAGEKALEVVRERGLRPEDIKLVAGAAGGPKWLVLGQLDRLLFSTWFTDRTEPLFLMGASIGAWRFAALSQNDPVAALDVFEDAYIHQSYNHRPAPADVSAESRRIMSAFVTDRAIEEVMNHPVMRPNILAVRCRLGTGNDHKIPLIMSLGAAAAANTINRKFLSFFFARTLFHHPGQHPPISAENGFSPHMVPLSPANFREALLASGSIPFVMEGVADIPGAPPGVYRDGGLADYHLDLPYSAADDDLVLFPHYMPRIIPGWFDKQLKWRRPHAEYMRNVIMVSPSREFIEKLPTAKIPDRNDFYLFEGKDKERIRYWQQVVKESRRIADAFQDAVESGRIRDMVRPMPT